MGFDFSGVGAALAAVSERSFVAVMAVGDDQLLILHGFLNFGDAIRARDNP